MDWSWLPDYKNLTPTLFGLYVLAGLFGALVRVAWLDKPIRGFFRDRGGWRLGFWGEVVIGVAVAVLIDGHPIRAGIAAIFAPGVLWAVHEALLQFLGSDRRKKE
jgi:hypothetical protein